MINKPLLNKQLNKLYSWSYQQLKPGKILYEEIIIKKGVNNNEDFLNEYYKLEQEINDLEDWINNFIVSNNYKITHLSSLMFDNGIYKSEYGFYHFYDKYIFHQYNKLHFNKYYKLKEIKKVLEGINNV